MSIYYTRNNKLVRVEDQYLDRGGEGEVFKVKDLGSNLCAKIYYQKERTKEKEEKILQIVKYGSSKKQDDLFLLCFPTETLYDKNKNFVGFLMPLAFLESIKLYELVTYNIGRNLPNKWHIKYARYTVEGIKNRLKLCVNIAIAVHKIHETKKNVLVDFKPQNVLITSDAKISLIDLDSIQIFDGNRTKHSAKVATPEYSPKESSFLNPSTHTIPETWDRFSLAVVFYEILFGIHPYASTSAGQYSDATTISDKISKDLFVHGSKKSYLTVIPPIHDNFYNLPKSLRELFFAAFENGSQIPSTRPSAESWGKQIILAITTTNIRPVIASGLATRSIRKEVRQESVVNPTTATATTSQSIGLGTNAKHPKEPSYFWRLFYLACFAFIVFFLVSKNDESKHGLVNTTDIADSSVTPSMGFPQEYVAPQIKINNIKVDEFLTSISISYKSGSERKISFNSSGYLKVGNKN